MADAVIIEGFVNIGGLDEFTGLRVLWLESNNIMKIENLDKCTELRCLYVPLTTLFNSAISCLPLSVRISYQCVTPRVSAPLILKFSFHIFRYLQQNSIEEIESIFIRLLYGHMLIVVVLCSLCMTVIGCYFLISSQIYHNWLIWIP